MTIYKLHHVIIIHMYMLGYCFMVLIPQTFYNRLSLSFCLIFLFLKTIFLLFLCFCLTSNNFFDMGHFQFLLKICSYIINHYSLGLATKQELDSEKTSLSLQFWPRILFPNHCNVSEKRVVFFKA